MYSVLRTPMGESCDGKQLMHRFFLMQDWVPHPTANNLLFTPYSVWSTYSVVLPSTEYYLIPGDRAS